MSVRLVVKNSLPASFSRYRLLDERDREVAWANQFLDSQKVRQLSLRSLRAYAYDLLHLARWLKVHDTRWVGLSNRFCSSMYVTNASNSP
jgi:hypothetical protein